MGTMMVRIVFFCLLGMIAAFPQDELLRSNLEFSDFGTNLDEPAYRLRDSVYPTDINVELDVYLEEARFSGEVTLDVEVRESGLQQIVFHQKVVSIGEVTITNKANNADVPLRSPEPFDIDTYYELLLLNFIEPVPVGNYSIFVKYEGQINTNPIDRGFYRGYYYINNEKRLYATTQFQPYHARKAFPCFDEPQFKSRFTISITRDSSLSPSFSNMAIQSTEVQGGRTRENFYPTPIISAYLVAFHVSDFVATHSTSTAARPFSIISRQGVTSQHEYAADIGIKITNALDDYLSIEYHTMGQGTVMKNDHIALPDFPSGAMENWGMVNYREAYLLYDVNNTNIINKIFIGSIISHELGHKWFGNLVTCFWWSNLWLNESFASFFEYFATHWADPSLELDDQFVVDHVHSALNSDSSPFATPMNWTAVANQASISNHFSVTSYAKGASVLRMLEHFVGWRTFRNALRHYLIDNEYEIGTPAKMYAAFEKAVSEDFEFLRDFPNVDIAAVFDSWVQNPGSPVLHVTRNPNTGSVTISQQRYVVSGTPSSQTWQIPFTWTEANSLNFDSTKPNGLLTTETTTLSSEAGADNFVIFNIAQSGLYRVSYDEDNWNSLAAYLKSSNRQNIHKLNRAQIVNDVLYFIRSGTINTTLGFEVLDFLRFETDYYVWNGALSMLDWIRRRLEHVPEAHDTFVQYILHLMTNVINSLGYDERDTDSTSTILNRMQIMNFACNFGHSGCVNANLAKFRQLVNGQIERVPVNERRYVYCLGIREGNRTDYDFLFQKYNTSENTADMVVILRALACTKDKDTLEHYLTQSMHNDKIRLHDRTNAFSFALQGNRENIPVVLDFLYKNFAEIRTTYGGGARLATCLNAIPAHLTNFTIINEYQEWAYTEQTALGSEFVNAASGVTTAMSNLEWGNNALVEIFTFTSARSASASIIASSILIIAAICIQMFR